MCLLFFTPLFLRLVPAAAVGGLRPVELPFQILFLVDLTLPELLLTELPLLQELIQQAIAEADCHVLFREIWVGGVCDLVEPGAGVVLVQLEQSVHHILCGVQGRLIEGTVVHVQHLRNLAEQLFLGCAGVAFEEQHRAELTAYRAAAAYFKANDLTKLPSPKKLEAEYAQLASEKAKFYEQYKEAKEELLKLKTAKQNVASFFREEEQTQQER